MRKTFHIYGIRDGQELRLGSITSPAQGRALEKELAAKGYERMRVRDVLGGLRMETNLETGRRTMTPTG